MSNQTNQYHPDHAVPVGWVLAERLQAHGISQAELARRCGRSPKLISEIFSGKAPLEPATALQFEKVLGLDASVWVGIESEYRLFKAREAERELASAAIDWARRFPVRELIRRGLIEKSNSDAELVSKVLAFFAVASVDAWEARYSTLHIAYRHSRSIESNREALLTWLRLAELDGEQQPCAAFNESRFRSALQEIRNLTLAPIERALTKATRMCNEAGVALALVPPMPRTAVSGASKWLTRNTAMLALSARHKSNDHLWFSLFHEAAHILLHGKRRIFVDMPKGESSSLEVEANDWATNALVPKRAWKKFVAERPRSERAVREFAHELGIAPGIVVGMLQHHGHIPWSHLNGLKERYRWVSD